MPVGQAINPPFGEAAKTASWSPRDRVRGLVVGILAARQAARPFSDDETLIEIGMTSMDMVTLLLSVESEFNVDVPQHEINVDVFRSVATIHALIGRLLPAGVPA